MQKWITHQPNAQKNILFYHRLQDCAKFENTVRLLVVYNRRDFFLKVIVMESDVRESSLWGRIAHGYLTSGSPTDRKDKSQTTPRLLSAVLLIL